MIDADPKPRIVFVYDEQGNVYTNEVIWMGEIIQVISNPQNAVTRELQRSDEIVQALLKSRNGMKAEPSNAE